MLAVSPFPLFFSFFLGKNNDDENLVIKNKILLPDSSLGSLKDDLWKKLVSE